MFVLVFLMVKWSIKLIWLMLVFEFWLCWALLAIVVALIASVTGHERVARQWMRSLNWHRAFRGML